MYTKRLARLFVSAASALLFALLLNVMVIYSQPTAELAQTDFGGGSDTESDPYLADVSSMFGGAIAFNRDIIGWETGSVTDMGSMFYDAGVWEQVGVAGFSPGQAQIISLALDNDGTPYVGYSDFANDVKASVMKFNGTAWEQVGAAGFTASAVDNNSLAIWNGIPYLAYRDWANGYKASVMKFDGTAWVQVGAAGFSAGQAVEISLAIWNGTPYVAYRDDANSSKASVMKFDGTAWVQVGAVGFSAGRADDISLKIWNGTPYVAYQDWDNGLEASVMRFNGTAWVHVGAAGFSPGTAADTSLALDNDGTPYVAYRDGANSVKASVMKFNGTAWQQVGVAGFSAGTVSWTSLALADGTPFVAYRDYANSYKASVMKFDGTAWQQVGAAGFTAGDANYISLALADGTPYVAYSDVANGSRASVMKYAELGAPAPFGKTNPTDGETDLSLSPTLTWESSTGADSYEYCLGNSSGDCDLLDWANVGGETSVALSDLDTATTYHWQVRAVNPGGTTYADDGTGWSFTTVPDAPAAFGKTAPADGATAVSISPTLVWETSAGADSYEYCLGNSSGACDLLNWTNVGENTSVALSDLDTATTYHWQVRAVNTGGATYADDGTDWSFTTVPDAPAAFGKTAPADGATDVSLSPTLTWQASSGADSYEYCLGSSSGACDLLDWTNVGEDTSVALSDLDTATTYHWQVRAVNTGGVTYADDGTDWSFTTVPDAPATFGKTAPADGATAVSLSPTLTWQASAGADSYEYCLGSSSSACDLLDWTNVGEDTSVALSDLDTATTYHWQARAVNPGGATYADEGMDWSFTTVPDAPAAFGKTAPANGATAVSISPTLAWESSADADSYEYCLGSASGACDLLDWTDVGEDTSVDLSGLTAATTCYWQVRAANSGGTTEADNGAWWSFTTTLDEPVTNVILHRRPLGEVLVGNPVRFAVTADGTRPFTYTWSLNGNVVGENRYIYEQLFTAAGTYTVGVTVANILNAVYAETLVTVVEPVVGLPDLSLSDKLSSLSFVESGDTLTYTLLLRNTADVVATATLTDPIPTYTTYLPGSAHASHGDIALIGDAIVWHGAVISGTPVLIQFAVTVGDAPIGAQIVNSATLDDGLGNLLELVSRATVNPGYRLTINDGALATGVPTVALRYAWNVADAITHVQFSNDGGFGAGSSAWLSVNPSDPTLADWTLDVYGDFRMPYLVFARFRNAEGQTYGPVMDWIIYDPTAPRISGVEIIAGTGLAQTFGNGVIVRITATDGNTGVARVQLSHTEDFASYEEVGFTGPTTDVPWTLGSGGKVYVRAVDRAGNISAPVSAGTEQHLVFLPFVIRANPINGQANVDQDNLMDYSGGGEAAAMPAGSNWLAMQPEEVYMPRRD